MSSNIKKHTFRVTFGSLSVRRDPVDGPQFSVEGRTWLLRYHPSWSAIDLVKVSGKDCRASFVLKLLTGAFGGGLSETYRRSSNRQGLTRHDNFLRMEDCNSFSHHPSNRSDSMTLEVEVSIYGEEEDEVRSAGKRKQDEREFSSSHPPQKASRTLTSELADLADDKSLADVSIVTADGSITMAHKLVLSIRSPVLRAMFSNSMSESQTNRIVIDDCIPDTVKIFIRYLYRDAVAESALEEHALELFGIAEKYEVTGLRDLCAEYLESCLNVENVLDLLMFAELHSAKTLRTAALRCVHRYSVELVQQPFFCARLQDYLQGHTSAAATAETEDSASGTDKYAGAGSSSSSSSSSSSVRNAPSTAAAAPAAVKTAPPFLQDFLDALAGHARYNSSEPMKAGDTRCLSRWSEDSNKPAAAGAGARRVGLQRSGTSLPPPSDSGYRGYGPYGSGHPLNVTSSPPSRSYACYDPPSAPMVPPRSHGASLNCYSFTDEDMGGYRALSSYRNRSSSPSWAHPSISSYPLAHDSSANRYRPPSPVYVPTSPAYSPTSPSYSPVDVAYLEPSLPASSAVLDVTTTK